MLTQLRKLHLVKTTMNENFYLLVLAWEVASADTLEADDSVGNLQISFLLQVGQDSSAEEDFTLTHPEQVAIQLQSFNLNTGRKSMSLFLFCLVKCCGLVLLKRKEDYH